MSDDNIYYNIQISNLNNTSGKPLPIQYTDTRSLPLVESTTGYKMSIIRFRLDTQSLPVWIPAIQSNQSNVNLTTYSITLQYTNPSTNQSIQYQAFMIFEPQDLSSSPPTTVPTSYTDASNSYYYVFNYLYVMKLINQTFASAYDGLYDTAQANGIDLGTNQVPSMEIDLNTGLCSISFDGLSYGYEENGKINIFFNTNLYSLFSTFPFIIKGYNQSNGMNYQLSISSDSNGKVTQEASTLGILNPVQSIVFTSTLIPVIPTNIASPQLISNGSIISLPNVNNNTSNVLTDFVSESLLFNPYLVYEPAVYRYINLIQNKMISSVDLQIYWLSKTGQYIPFTLSAEASCSIKMLFTRVEK